LEARLRTDELPIVETYDPQTGPTEHDPDDRRPRMYIPDNGRRPVGKAEGRTDVD
jgi:hypothetical protein